MECLTCMAEEERWRLGCLALHDYTWGWNQLLTQHWNDVMYVIVNFPPYLIILCELPFHTHKALLQYANTATPFTHHSICLFKYKGQCLVRMMQWLWVKCGVPYMYGWEVQMVTRLFSITIISTTLSPHLTLTVKPPLLLIILSRV